MTHLNTRSAVNGGVDRDVGDVDSGASIGLVSRSVACAARYFAGVLVERQRRRARFQHQLPRRVFRDGHHRFPLFSQWSGRIQRGGAEGHLARRQVSRLDTLL